MTNSKLNDLIRSFVCPKCLGDSPLYQIACGHLFCGKCLNIKNIAGELIAKHCSLCFKKFSVKEVCLDIVFNDLAKKAKKFYQFKSTDNSYAKQSSEANESTKTNFTRNVNETFINYADDINVSKESILQKSTKVTYADKSQQTTNISVNSSEVPCNFYDGLKSQMKSVETQTDYDNSIQLSESSTISCCANDNLKKILNLNTWSAFNSFIQDLLQNDSCFPKPDETSSTKNGKSSNISCSRNVDMLSGDFVEIEPQKFESPNTVISTKNVELEKIVDANDTCLTDSVDSKSAENCSSKKMNCDNNSEQLKKNYLVQTGDSIQGQKKRKPELLNKLSIMENECFENISNVVELGEETENNLKPANKKMKKEETVINDGNFKKSETKRDSRTKKPSTEKSNETSSINESHVSKNLKYSQRSTPKEKKKYVIIYSGMKSNEIEKMENARSILKFDMVKEWTNDVTHLVVNLEKGSSKQKMLTKRSFKCLMALVGHKWIVSFDWISDSLKVSRFLNELPYEIQGFRNCLKMDCPLISRTTKPPSFFNYVVFLMGTFPNFPGQISELSQIIEIGKGTVTLNKDEFNNMMKTKKNGMKFLVVTHDGKSKFKNAINISLTEFINCITVLNFNFKV